MSVSLKLTCPHILDTEGDVCDFEFEVDAEVESGGMEGQDADGNRGMYVAPWVTWGIEYLPDTCPSGLHDWNDTDRAALSAQMEHAAMEYDLGDRDDDYDESMSDR